MSPRDRRALILGGLFIAVAVLYRVVLSPVMGQWGEARAAAEARSTMVERFEEQLERRDKIRGRLEPRFGLGVHDALRTVDEARVAFPRSVQEAIGRGGATAKQVEVQGVRRLRDVPGVDLLSLRVQVDCQAPVIPQLFSELCRADVPVIVESVSLVMPQPGQRQNWQANLVLSTPAKRQEEREGNPS
ncbi:MAG: hypothetical protein AAF333_01110 [Planctomycetota bacterium]